MELKNMKTLLLYTFSILFLIGCQQNDNSINAPKLQKPVINKVILQKNDIGDTLKQFDVFVELKPVERILDRQGNLHLIFSKRQIETSNKFIVIEYYDNNILVHKMIYLNNMTITENTEGIVQHFTERYGIDNIISLHMFGKIVYK